MTNVIKLQVVNDGFPIGKRLIDSQTKKTYFPEVDEKGEIIYSISDPLYALRLVESSPNLFKVIEGTLPAIKALKKQKIKTDVPLEEMNFNELKAIYADKIGNPFGKKKAEIIAELQDAGNPAQKTA